MGRKGRNKDCRFMIQRSNVVGISAADSRNPLKKNLFGSFEIDHGWCVMFYKGEWAGIIIHFCQACSKKELADIVEDYDSDWYTEFETKPPVVLCPDCKTISNRLAKLGIGVDRVNRE